MSTITVDIGTLIVETPDIRGGRPRIAGTGVTVQRIVGWYKLGLTPEEIADRIGHLTLAQVHAALAYYHANRDEIEAAIRAEEVEAERLKRQHYRSIEASR
ncbi:MAG: DUF433 domain-containing protein [Chloroflexi bacterium]|jgi:uncharacterized protein (DUF433 family)|nr:DUF433 domain-containing protein [Chloroflexota bacterium]